MLAPEPFGIRLVAYQRRLGVSNAELADRMGVDERVITRWRSIHSFPTVEHVWRLADVFETTIDELVGRTHALELSEDELPRL